VRGQYNRVKDTKDKTILVGVVMGSKSDWETMSHAVQTLDTLGIPNEARVLSAHRTPDQAIEYAATARERGLAALIAGAGGAPHLGGVLAAKTSVPVLGVPMATQTAGGLDSLLSIVQMPAGIPVATFAIGKAGAINAALFAAAMLAVGRADVREALDEYRRVQTERILANPDPRS